MKSPPHFPGASNAVPPGGLEAADARAGAVRFFRRTAIESRATHRNASSIPTRCEKPASQVTTKNCNIRKAARGRPRQTGSPGRIEVRAARCQKPARARAHRAIPYYQNRRPSTFLFQGGKCLLVREAWCLLSGLIIPQKPGLLKGSVSGNDANGGSTAGQRISATKHEHCKKPRESSKPYDFCI